MSIAATNTSMRRCCINVSQWIEARTQPIGGEVLAGCWKWLLKNWPVIAIFSLTQRENLPRAQLPPSILQLDTHCPQYSLNYHFELWTFRPEVVLSCYVEPSLCSLNYFCSLNGSRACLYPLLQPNAINLIPEYLFKGLKFVRRESMLAHLSKRGCTGECEYQYWIIYSVQVILTIKILHLFCAIKIRFLFLK